MRRIFLPAIFLTTWAHAQLTYTGGPVNNTSESWAIWARNDSAVMGYDKALYRTLDGGDNWELLTNGIGIDVDPRTIEYTDGKLIVGTNSGSRIYQSDDFGESFTAGTGSLSAIVVPTASTSGTAFSMMGGTNFDPHTFDFGTDDWTSTGNGGITHGMTYLGQDTIWICSGGTSSGTTSYSHDNGQTWTPVTTEPVTDIGGGIMWTTYAQDFVKAGSRIVIYTNLNGFPILYTDDYGTTWNAGSLSSTSYSDYGKKFIKVNDNHLITVNLGGLFKSTDQGATWSLIQPIGAIRTIQLWKGDKVLVGTANGVYEYDNYGEGSLIKTHGVGSTPSNLVLNNGTLIGGNKSAIHKYDLSGQTWSLLNDTVFFSGAISGSRMALTGDSLFAFTSTNYFISGDDGMTFKVGDISRFGYQMPSMAAQLNGQKFMATYYNGGGGPQPPRIYYSSDDGASYTQAAFTNSVSYGLGGNGGNFVEKFLETSNGILVADLNAGYALSSDGGQNWTFEGGVWMESYLAVNGNRIYRMTYESIPSDERKFEYSDDNGVTWNDVALTGLPNSGSAGYLGFWGVWNAGGEIYTYNAFESPRGLYAYNEGTSSWSAVANSSYPVDDWVGITDLTEANGELFVNWTKSGVWTTGAVSTAIDTQQSFPVMLFPNPVSDVLNIQASGDFGFEVFNIDGKLVFSGRGRDFEQFNTINLSEGLYHIVIEKGNERIVKKFVK